MNVTDEALQFSEFAKLPKNIPLQTVFCQEGCLDCRYIRGLRLKLKT